MPRVKIDYIVSFSSEDPENQASNLLAWEVNKKKWLCKEGEPSCSVVLQLAKAVKICTVHIGAYHSALVEVLVGRSETPNEPFQVLVPSSVFQAPGAARRGEAPERVRSFAGAALAAAAAAQRWDRLRVVCTQPYNKHCKYGLSFVHVYSPEEAAPAPAPLDPLSSDEEEFRPGELFAKHVQKSKDEPAADTGAQIRRATSQALRNTPDSSIKLTKAPVQKPNKRRSSRADDRTGAGDQRRRDDLLYTDDDARPHDKIDRVLSRHNDERARDDETTTKHKDKAKDGSHKKDDKWKDGSHKKDDKSKEGLHKKDDKSKEGLHKKDHKPKNSLHKKEDKQQSDGDEPSKRDRDEASSSGQGRPSEGDDGTGKRARAATEQGGECAPLRGVVFVLSGYENPRRAHVRDTALALGAACRRDWTPDCTHLICAFPNTPKLRSVRAGAAGAAGAAAVAVRAEWVEACARRRRRLPWRWFATEPARREPPPPHWDSSAGDEECDTDDEIERVRRKMKKRRTERAASPPSPRAAPPPPSADTSASSDVVFVKDERIQEGVCAVESEGSSTDEEPRSAFAPREEVSPGACLPAFLRGRACALAGAGAGAARLARYVRAYGGLVVDEEEGEPDYVVCGPGVSRRGDRCVRAAWLWRCHREGRLCPADDYRLA